MGRFSIQDRNAKGQMVVNFAERMEMAGVNTSLQKRQEHRVTYESSGKSTQVDYILCRRYNLKEISDCKVEVGGMTLVIRKMKRAKAEQKTKW